MAAERGDVSDDAVLGGRLVLRQPLSGHRVGHDAILLGAATFAQAGEQAVDLGAGIGAAGLALARRVEGLNVTLLEIDQALCALSRDNAECNDLGARVQAVCLDVTSPPESFAAAGLAAGATDRVLMNPPFHAANNPSADPNRRIAHTASPQTLRQWVGAAFRLLRPSGVLTLIWRADGLAEVLAALIPDFGGIAVLPVYPKHAMAAIRVLACAEKASHAPLTLLPGFVLADAGGKPSAEAEAVLRHGAAIDLARR